MGTLICPHSCLKEEHFGDQFAYTCNGCKETGYDSCYTCTTRCNYHLHKACHNAPTTMAHPFYQQGPFVLDKSIILPPGLGNLCAACGTTVQGWRYVSTTNGGHTITLHPCCMQLPQQTLYSPLQNIECVHCQSMGVEKGKIKGWAYVKDGVALHVWCIKDMIHKGWLRRHCTPSHGQTNQGYGSQERGVPHAAHYQGGGVPGRRRKRDYFFIGLAGIIQGLIDLNSALDTLGNFLGIASIWGSQDFDPFSWFDYSF